jgi:hypothetical protein
VTQIKPTIGRVVWFYPHGHREGSLPHAAMIAFVHSDNLVNLGVLDPNGRSHNETSVSLIQDGDAAPDSGRFATWMPFQIGQAKQAEEKTAATETAKPVVDTAAQTDDVESTGDTVTGFDGHDIADAHRDGFAAGQQTQQAGE